MNIFAFSRQVQCKRCNNTFIHQSSLKDHKENSITSDQYGSEYATRGIDINGAEKPNIKRSHGEIVWIWPQYKCNHGRWDKTQCCRMSIIFAFLPLIMIFAKTTFSDIQIFARIGKTHFEHPDACHNDWWEIQKMENLEF